MTHPVAPAVAAPPADAQRTASVRARISLYVGAASAVALGLIVLFAPTSSGDAFHHIGDYFLTADGLPFVLAPAILLGALRTRQDRRDGRLGLAGAVAFGVAAAALAGMFVYGLIAATGRSLGPTYVLLSSATDIGLILFAIGSWRAGLLPRWLLVAWPVTWVVGGLLPILPPGPLLLAAVYVAMALVLRHRATTERRPY